MSAKKVLVILIALLTLFMLIWAIYPILSLRFEYARQDGKYTYDLSPQDTSVEVTGHFETSGSELTPDQLIFFIDDIHISDSIYIFELKDLVNIQNVCAPDITGSISIESNSGSRDHRGFTLLNRYAKYPDYAICTHRPGDSDGFTYTPTPTRFPSVEEEVLAGLGRMDRIENDLDPYFYYAFPFDNVKVTIELGVNLVYLDSKGEIIKEVTVPPNFVYHSSINKLGKYRLVSTDTTGDGKKNTFEFKFDRFPIIRYFAALLLFFLVLIPPIIPLVESISNAIEISMVFLFGLWGFRQIIVPTPEISQNLVDLILIGEYCLTIFSLALTILALARKHREHDLKNGSLGSKFYSLLDSQVFHSPKCSVILKHQKSNLIQYEDIEDAIKSGKRSCKLCRHTLE